MPSLNSIVRAFASLGHDLETLSEIELSEAEQIKLATKRRKIQFHSSHASGSDDEVNEEDSFDPRVHTPSHAESPNDEESQGMHVEGDELDEEETNEKDEGNELYRDVNVNLEG
nr:hypothetical protein [Tanacetum cinerariifolium]